MTMDRRSFLTGSAAASALSLAGFARGVAARGEGGDKPVIEYDKLWESTYFLPTPGDKVLFGTPGVVVPVGWYGAAVDAKGWTVRRTSELVVRNGERVVKYDEAVFLLISTRDDEGPGSHDEWSWAAPLSDWTNPVETLGGYVAGGEVVPERERPNELFEQLVEFLRGGLPFYDTYGMTGA